MVFLHIYDKTREEEKEKYEEKLKEYKQKLKEYEEKLKQEKIQTT